MLTVSMFEACSQEVRSSVVDELTVINAGDRSYSMEHFNILIAYEFTLADAYSSCVLCIKDYQYKIIISSVIDESTMINAGDRSIVCTQTAMIEDKFTITDVHICVPCIKDTIKLCSVDKFTVINFGDRSIMCTQTAIIVEKFTITDAHICVPCIKNQCCW